MIANIIYARSTALIAQCPFPLAPPDPFYKSMPSPTPPTAARAHWTPRSPSTSRTAAPDDCAAEAPAPAESVVVGLAEREALVPLVLVVALAPEVEADE